MWSLAITIYFGCKWLTWRRTPVASPAWRQAGYLLAWPGMDAAAFLKTASPQVERPKLREWLFAWAKLVLGLLSFFWIARLVPAGLVCGWIGIAGLAFIFHFGTFHVLSCLWRSLGIAAVPLMDWPIASRSPSDFWGRRWNRAFRDLTNRFLFRPLARRVGGPASLVLGFLLSGMIHDAVISFPARGGYGLPTLYFLIQGFAILLGHSPLGRRWGLQHGIRGWLFTVAAVVLFAGLLFHSPFIREIILPFMTSLGALP